MDIFKLTGQNLGRIFNFGYGNVHAVHLNFYQVKRHNLWLEAWPVRLSTIRYRAPLLWQSL
jgi:hypothetical protein